MSTEKPTLQFIVLSEAWYGPANLNNRTDDLVDDINIGLNYPSGGTAGEFTIRWERIGGKVAPKIEIWHDAWTIFDEPKIQALFRALATAAQPENFPNPTVDRVKKILDGIGIEDATPRTRA